MKIRIKDLRARTIIGINEWEREQKQEIIINIEITFDGSRAAETDNIEDTVNYKRIKKTDFRSDRICQLLFIRKIS